MNALKLTAKILVGVAVVYALLVAAFETWLAYAQPEQRGETLTITTLGEGGEQSTRVLTRLMVNGKLYLAANHWPRGWYNAALANPLVDIEMDGVRAPYLAIPLGEAEEQAVNQAEPLPLFARVLFGFAPRKILRMDPVAPPQPQ